MITCAFRVKPQKNIVGKRKKGRCRYRGALIYQTKEGQVGKWGSVATPLDVLPYLYGKFGETTRIVHSRGKSAED